MVSAEDYLATVRDRLLEDGCEVTDETIGPLRATGSCKAPDGRGLARGVPPARRLIPRSMVVGDQ
jgi:hypothetical protein